MPGKNRATGYSDYYKGTSRTPGNTQSDAENTESDVPQTAKERRMAIQRRLKRKRQ